MVSGIRPGIARAAGPVREPRTHACAAVNRGKISVGPTARRSSSHAPSVTTAAISTSKLAPVDDHGRSRVVRACGHPRASRGCASSTNGGGSGGGRRLPGFRMPLDRTRVEVLARRDARPAQFFGEAGGLRAADAVVMCEGAARRDRGIESRPPGAIVRSLARRVPAVAGAKDLALPANEK